MPLCSTDIYVISTCNSRYTVGYPKQNRGCNSFGSRSQWPRGLRHEMSSPAWTLGSWVQILLEAWMFVCLYSVFVLSCVGSGLATGWSLVQGVLPTVYNCKITEPHKEEAKARYGLERHIRRRRRTALRFSPLLLFRFFLLCSIWGSHSAYSNVGHRQTDKHVRSHRRLI
jgi:hypothetical protein